MIRIDGEHLSLEEVIKVARDYEPVMISKEAIEKMKRSQGLIEKSLNSDQTIYGINTGCGNLASKKIRSEDLNTLQQNLIRSHSCGVGPILTTDVVRSMMVLRANSLVKGYSGIRPSVVQLLIDFLNHHIHPLVPSKGSIGASGDLAPLAHIALCLIGEGTVEFQEKCSPVMDVLRIKGLSPVTLSAKEGLALINGTQLMTALGCLCLYDAEALLKTAQIAGAMSLEALKGTDRAFHESIHRVRPHQGQIQCAENLRRLTEKSEIIQSHKSCPRVQDAYSLRCMPQVFGATKDVFRFIRSTLEIEMNAATDNPLIFPEEELIISGGNFHGQPLAYALDFLGIALSEIGNISERRIARLIDDNLSGLPAFLSKSPGLHSGLMIPQYVAAALVNENKTLCHPSSCDSIPSSANKEDHVSMGANAGLHALQIVENIRYIVAIELITAAQGLNFLHPLQPSDVLQAVYEYIRTYVPSIESDRSLAADIGCVNDLIKKGYILKQVEEKIGPLI